MKEYIDKPNYIKHFDINKFDDEIKYIMNKIFDEYYYNQNENIYYLIRQFSNIYYRMSFKLSYYNEYKSYLRKVPNSMAK